MIGHKKIHWIYLGLVANGLMVIVHICTTLAWLMRGDRIYYFFLLALAIHLYFFIQWRKELEREI